ICAGTVRTGAPCARTAASALELHSIRSRGLDETVAVPVVARNHLSHTSGHLNRGHASDECDGLAPVSPCEGHGTGHVTTVSGRDGRGDGSPLDRARRVGSDGFDGTPFVHGVEHLLGN